MLTKLNLSILILLGLIAVCAGKFNIGFLEGDAINHWAVLVAGSNGFWNYRHQSDIFHAYHILLKNGMPKENIIVLAYDDIANDDQNPFKGKVFNKPDPTGEGVNVYEGVEIDYKGDAVTPQNFLAVLEGNEEAVKGVGTGRVLKSTVKENVFIYFSDHGGTGLIAFPNAELYADQLNQTLNKMHLEKRYRELVFYLEACESGSMFNKILDKKMKIYTTTASNPDQSSWAAYCSPDDKVNGKQIGSCLGDEYSVNWMEDSEESPELKESLELQFENVKNMTKNSEVHQYGDLTIKNNQIGYYQGNIHRKNIIQKVLDIWRRNKHHKEKKEVDLKYKEYLRQAKTSQVDSREAKLRYLYEKAQRENDINSHQNFIREIKHMKKADSIFSSFNTVFNVNVSSDELTHINFECLRPSVEAYKKLCQWGEYDLKYVRNIALACNKDKATSQIIQTEINQICSSLNNKN